jgi:hypothetical protein
MSHYPEDDTQYTENRESSKYWQGSDAQYDSQLDSYGHYSEDNTHYTENGESSKYWQGSDAQYSRQLDSYGYQNSEVTHYQEQQSSFTNDSYGKVSQYCVHLQRNYNDMNAKPIEEKSPTPKPTSDKKKCTCGRGCVAGAGCR